MRNNRVERVKRTLERVKQQKTVAQGHTACVLVDTYINDTTTLLREIELLKRKSKS